ncbi:AAA family ATPase [Streptomyces sp. NPDC088745]|uniref:AAA family ATPase n=1 Tax=Streptomyces sp. NPDC088745 TaxID=3365884 RepID=UPI003808333D
MTDLDPTHQEPTGSAALPPGALLVAVGPAASGKSTFADTAPVDVVVCLDVLRGELGGGPGDQTATPAAVARQDSLLEQYLSAGTSVFVDSTNLEERVRAGLVERARRHKRPAVALRFLTDLDTCRARNELRPADRCVPEDTLRWQHRTALAVTPEVLYAEGFTAVYTIRHLPEVRFAVLTTSDRRHAFYWAAPAESFDQLLTVWNREEDITAAPFEFTDPELVAETQAWIARTRQESGRLSTVMVGSVEDGRWVNWNLDSPRPPVPAS